MAKRSLCEATITKRPHKKRKLSVSSLSSDKRGNVWIASMQRKSKWPEHRDSAGMLIKRINVTSGSANKIEGESAKTVSPMYLGPVTFDLLKEIGVQNPQNDDVEALIFENYWQYGKIFEGLGHVQSHGEYEVTLEWKQFRKRGYAEKKGHRHPRGTKTNEVLYQYTNGKRTCNKYKYHIASSSYYFGDLMGYIESRKRVYCPLYEALVMKTAFYEKLKKKVDDGMDVMILDFDGPRGKEKCLKVDLEMLRQKINDTTAPFGHGYVFAALLAGFPSSKYCEQKACVQVT